MVLICCTLKTAFIVKKLVACVVWGEGHGIRTSSCSPPLTGCLLLCASHSYSYMIDNVILLITGTLHQRSIAELVPKCHPLGSFEQMEAVNIAQTPAELYNAILVDTPLGEPLRWRREEVGISVNASMWGLLISGVTLSQNVRPALCCLPLCSPRLPLPSSPPHTAFSFTVALLGQASYPKSLTQTTCLCETG